METRNLYCDLHTHTNYSDGFYSNPKQNVMLAVFNGIDVFSITDHDTILGYKEGKKYADRVGLTFLPGVEITTSKYHLLALNFNPEDKSLLDFLEYSKHIQNERCRQRISRLREYNFPVTFQEVKKAFPYSRLTKFNIFCAMQMNQGCRDIMEREYPNLSPSQRFRKYFSENGMFKGFVDIGVPESEAIYYVHEASGKIGIAHPHKDIDDMSEMDKLFERGIDFVETQPNLRGKETGRYKTEDFEKFAERHFLPITYGSDYHGPTFDRQFLSRGENVLSKELVELLNSGYIKIPNLEGVCLHGCNFR